MGQQRSGGRTGRGDGLLRRRPHAGNAGHRFHFREHLPDLKIRVVNVVDLMKLEPDTEGPRDSETDYDSLFTKDKHIIFAFHGYPG